MVGAIPQNSTDHPWRGWSRQHLAAFAQEASPAVTLNSRANLLVVGSWQLETLEEPGHITIGVINVDGAYLEYDPAPRFGVGIGHWLAVGEREVKVVTNYQAVARMEETTLERTMFAVD